MNRYWALSEYSGQRVGWDPLLKHVEAQFETG